MNNLQYRCMNVLLSCLLFGATLDAKKNVKKNVATAYQSGSLLAKNPQIAALYEQAQDVARTVHDTDFTAKFNQLSEWVLLKKRKSVKEFRARAKEFLQSVKSNTVLSTIQKKLLRQFATRARRALVRKAVVTAVTTSLAALALLGGATGAAVYARRQWVRSRDHRGSGGGSGGGQDSGVSGDDGYGGMPIGPKVNPMLIDSREGGNAVEPNTSAEESGSSWLWNQLRRLISPPTVSFPVTPNHKPVYEPVGDSAAQRPLVAAESRLG